MLKVGQLQYGGWYLVSIRTKYHPPIPSRPLSIVSAALQNQPVLLKKDSIIILVCGAQYDQLNEHLEKPKREIFLDYVKRNIPQYLFFKAEQVFKVLQKEKEDDLLTLEDIFSTYTDSIIMFLESPGTFTELGAFAMKDDIAKLMLVINNRDWQDQASFINHGPLRKINKLSKFGDAIYADFSKILKSADCIEKKLANGLKKKGKSYDLRSTEIFNAIDPKIRLFLISDIVDLFSPIEPVYVTELFQKIYGEEIDISIELAILQAVKVLDKKHMMFINIKRERESFFRYNGFRYDVLRSEIVNYYQKYYPEKSKILKERATI